MTFTKEILFTPAWDKRSSDPKKNYGVSAVVMIFLLKGPKATIQFVVGTNWHLEHVREEWKQSGYHPEAMAYDLGYHSPTPTYEGQQVQRQSCEYLGGKPCYYDGTSTGAAELFQLLITEGHEAVWGRMEEVYLDRWPAEEVGSAVAKTC